MNSKKRLITVAEARELLQVSKPTMARLIKEGRFSIYENPRDRRSKLLDVDEVERGPEPQLLHPAEDPAKKVAA